MSLRSFSILIVATTLVACQYQRTDLASNGKGDAVGCLQAREGSAELRALACERRGFAYDSPEYRLGYLDVTACARATGGTAEAAAQACRATGA